MKKLQSKNSGAMTVEAALVMPVLLCAFFTIIFLIKAVYTYGLIQCAIDETAAELASTGYIYYVSGIRDIHDSVRNGINEKSNVFKEQVESVFDAYNSLEDIGKSLINGVNGSGGSRAPIPNTDETPIPNADEAPIPNAYENFANLLEQAKSAASEPLEELKCIACFIASGTVEDAKTQLFIPVVKLYMKKYLVTDKIRDADERLKSLDIINGFEGLDFSESSFLSDREENIDIIVRYRIKLPLPIRLIPDFEFAQRAKAKAWLGGDDPRGALSDENNAADDIWSLSNFRRGLKIRRLFGANLPSNFPVIARFDGRKAVMIKSMDLTAESYQRGDNAEKTLMRYINELAEYKGQETPWGSDRIVIRKEDIKFKELVLVIPKNKLSEKNERMLAEMAGAAEAKGIRLAVERYGTKATAAAD